MACVSRAQTTSWYKMFTGTIGTYSVVMNLHHEGHLYEGYYYYSSREIPVFFRGNDTVSEGKIQLSATANAEQPETFEFVITGNTATGTWQPNAKKNALRLSLTESASPIAFKYIVVKGNVRLRNQLKDSPEAGFEASSVWPTGNTPADVFIQSQIRKLFNDKQNDTDITASLQNQKNEFLNGYIKDNTDVTDEDLKVASAMYNYSEQTNLLISYQSSKMVSLAMSVYSYTGGAHGNYGTNYLSLDLINKKALQLADILNTQGLKKLRPLLEKNFRKQYGLQPTDALIKGGLFDNKIEPNKNFFVTGKGLSFAYNPYEIGPYAMDEIDIFIPFTDVKAYLQKSFISLLQ